MAFFAHQSSEFASLTHPNEVTKEELVVFHTLDRQVFSCLVLCLCRDISDSMQVMALWIWLEQVSYRQFMDIILTFPDPLMDALFNESIMCLKLAGSDNFPSPSGHSNDVPLLQSLTGKDLSLRYFLENRVTVLHGMAKTLQSVCTRAFHDIVEQAVTSFNYPPPQGVQSCDPHGFNDYQEESGCQDKSFDKCLAFMTFDIAIEAMLMQHVSGDEQALYARLVVRSAEMMDDILGLGFECVELDLEDAISHRLNHICLVELMPCSASF
ncbi:hypothetical protein Nepgr_012341 [Nepenthes gracilis]|uniref:Uncharacterized protein n=1 Tax=Nepenthes gracilis TaxID=150966 RepID=A0AAD3XN96_NEPGR|nr:hypothetical protein Nepgr_012341 [Nepenthes gracilis]